MFYQFVIAKCWRTMKLDLTLLWLILFLGILDVDLDMNIFICWLKFFALGLITLNDIMTLFLLNFVTQIQIQLTSIDLENGLAPNRWQAIISNNDTVH